MTSMIAGAGRRLPGRLAGPAGARDEHGSGDYFASMTDMMIGLIFIFIIMLMAFALNLREAQQKTAEAQQKIVEAPPKAVEAPPKVVEATIPPDEADLARRDMLHELAAALTGVLPVSVDEQNGTLQLGGDILFPKGSAEAYPEALPKLRMLGYALDQVLPCYAVGAGDGPPPVRCAPRHKGRLDAVYIEGHTDTTPIRTPRFQNNWELSAARASATFAQLVQAYPALAALKNDKAERLIGVSGYGEVRPIDPAATDDARARNRRIELRFVMVPARSIEIDTVIDQINARRAR